MTRNQIEAARRTLPRVAERPWKDWTDEEHNLYEELNCREMINSCLCYGSIRDFWEVCEWRFGDKSYAAPYVRKLGRERVEKICKEQEADMARARVLRNVFTDSEGLHYNSIVWADEVTA